MTTQADYALQRAKGIKKSHDNAMLNKIEEFMSLPAIKFYNTSEVSEIYTSTEDMSTAKKLGILETPPTEALGDGYSVTINEERFGKGILLPEEVYRREGQDVTWKVNEYLKRQRNALLAANTHRLITNAHLMLNEAFDSTSIYLAPDGVEVCGSHSWNSGETFDNAVTDALDTDFVNDAEEYAGAFTNPSGKETPLNFTDVVVKKGSAAHREAIKLFAKEITPTAVNDINIYEGMYRIFATPYITPANKTYAFMMDLFMMDSPLAVGIGEAPTMREPQTESNEAIRINVTGFWKQGVINMPYQIYATDGTT
jgi:hypothetical protein